MTARAHADLRLVFLILIALCVGWGGSLALDRAQAQPAAQRAATDPSTAPGSNWQPTRRARFKAWLDESAEHTGGAFVAFALVLAIDRARRKWPHLDDGEGWQDEVLGTSTAALLWIGGSLVTGATWGATANGVLAAAAAGGLMALRPRRVKRIEDQLRAAADCVAPP